MRDSFMSQISLRQRGLDVQLSVNRFHYKYIAVRHNCLWRQLSSHKFYAANKALKLNVCTPWVNTKTVTRHFDNRVLWHQVLHIISTAAFLLKQHYEPFSTHRYQLPNAKPNDRLGKGDHLPGNIYNTCALGNNGSEWLRQSIKNLSRPCQLRIPVHISNMTLLLVIRILIKASLQHSTLNATIQWQQKQQSFWFTQISQKLWKGLHTRLWKWNWLQESKLTVQSKLLGNQSNFSGFINTVDFRYWSCWWVIARTHLSQNQSTRLKPQRWSRWTIY